MYECYMDSDLNIDKDDIGKFVDISIQNYGALETLSPRDFVIDPFKDEKRLIKILDEIREGEVDFRTIIANTLETE